MSNPQCSFTKADGSQCEGYAVDGSDRCFNHNPASQEAKRGAVRKGGLTARKPPLPPIEINRWSDMKPAADMVMTLLLERKIRHSEARVMMDLIKMRGKFLGIPEPLLNENVFP